LLVRGILKSGAEEKCRGEKSLAFAFETQKLRSSQGNFGDDQRKCFLTIYLIIIFWKEFFFKFFINENGKFPDDW